jgi:hypothetical protein
MPTIAEVWKFRDDELNALLATKGYQPSKDRNYDKTLVLYILHNKGALNAATSGKLVALYKTFKGDMTKISAKLAFANDHQSLFDESGLNGLLHSYYQ